jgi:serine/threonine protein kinase/tetratricopeptide (TPR) repeat protein
MMDMDRIRWLKVDRCFAELLDLAPSERPARVAAISRGDPELETVLLDLLESDAKAALLPHGPSAELVAQAFGSLGSDGRVAHEDLGEIPARVGPYRILEEIGRGGMASVYLAERDDPAFPQRVALKLLRRGLDTEDVTARFAAERRILASLHHPGIASVFDAGTAEGGRPYLVLEFVRGKPITVHSDDEALPVRARLKLFLAAARAVTHAHERGVVHRDIKPSNVFVTQDESQIRLLDFGIAKILDVSEQDGAAVTRTGTRAMTPGYASPEQVIGRPVGPRSDVYQLGVLLYELLTGLRPFPGLSRREYETAVTTRDPAPPSRAAIHEGWDGARGANRVQSAAHRAALRGVSVGKLRRTLSGDLDAIVMCALDRDPSARFASVMALHDDVRRYLAGKPVAARPRWVLKRVGTAVRLSRGAGILTLGAAAAALAFLWAESVPEVSTRRVATTVVRDETGNAAARLADQVTELLATNLARVPELQVVDLHRRFDVQAPLHEQEVLARSSGADELLRASIRNPLPGELELILRRVSSRDGQTLDSIQVAGRDAFELVDRATEALLRRLDIPSPSLRVSQVTTVNPEAYRFYVEGLTAFRSGDDHVADRFFRAALERDSSFAMAAYYAFRTAAGSDRDEALRLLNLSSELAASASLHDRLVIRGRWSEYMLDSSARIIADSLVALFPSDPEGHFLKGNGMVRAGDFLEAVTFLERAIRLDSLSLHAARAPCVSCDAFLSLGTAYKAADSLDSAVRVTRRWTDLQPKSARAWHALATNLMHQGNFEEALAAGRRAASLRPGNLQNALFPARVALHRGDHRESDLILGHLARTGTRMQRKEAFWWLAISLRDQGRYAEALEAAEKMYEASRPEEQDAFWDLPGASMRAQILFEMGRFAESAELFESIPREYDRYSPSRQARQLAWLLTHAGTARAAAGDTAALARLADSVEVIGAMSQYGRDQRLHHYLRALLSRLDGKPEVQVESQLRAALYSLPRGFSRINLELGASLMRQGRAQEAADVFRAALRNSAESNGLYVTRTELHTLLGGALAAAGQPDSAAVHHGLALRAWRAADPQLRSRVDSLASMLDSLKAVGSAPSNRPEP